MEDDLGCLYFRKPACQFYLNPKPSAVVDDCGRSQLPRTQPTSDQVLSSEVREEHAWAQLKA